VSLTAAEVPVEKTVAEIARLLEGEVMGDGQARIKGVAGIAEAQPGEITFLDSPQYASFLQTTAASAVIVSAETSYPGKTLIRVSQPRLAFARTMRLFYATIAAGPRGIHPTAVIGERVKLGQDVGIGAQAVVGDGVEIGDGAVIFPLVSIGERTRIGSGSVIYANVTIREGVIVGKDVIIHSGAVIGSDGFGYAQDGDHHLKIPQVGTVIIEDEVEIGANVSIDRGTLGATRIGRGTKIDNLVQIAHNVVIGPNTLLIAQVGISGSTRIGANVILAGQVGVVGHIEIGDHSMVAAQSGVSRKIPPKTVMFGTPARPIKKAKQIEACISRLPELFKRVHKLEKKGIPPQEEEA
jgi:UDP-3-O-[3-hydroxymyristoyl] glucosamine N-acyltransferase